MILYPRVRLKDAWRLTVARDPKRIEPLAFALGSFQETVSI